MEESKKLIIAKRQGKVELRFIQKSEKKTITVNRYYLDKETLKEKRQVTGTMNINEFEELKEAINNINFSKIMNLDGPILTAFKYKKTHIVIQTYEHQRFFKYLVVCFYRFKDEKITTLTGKTLGAILLKEFDDFIQLINNFEIPIKKADGV
jgi:hypothetical protein